MKKITPCLWFDNNGEEAMKFYTSVFKDSEILEVNHSPAADGFPEGVVTGTFRIADQELMVLNGGPEFKFTEAISLSVDCKDQAEVDYYWERLTADGGEESMCGWLKDKFGLSWQIVPEALPRLMNDPDKAKASAVMQAMLQMRKIDVPTLEKAYAAA
jgi:predicted 3-demethylubiquinone-9 3-methyltransferase (glyoxalase superfamily)